MDDEEKKVADTFRKYLDHTGISIAFQIIFAEVVDKEIPQNEAFTYTAERLRKIGDDLEKIKMVTAI